MLLPLLTRNHSFEACARVKVPRPARGACTRVTLLAATLLAAT